MHRDPDDEYDVSAELAPMFLATARDLLGDLPTALAGTDPTLPLLDLGAGTGISTVYLADMWPAASIMAVEPSRAQRTALMTRLASRPDLHSRVSVIPNELFRAELPPRWGGAIALHLICQLEPDQRRALLGLLQNRLAPGAPAVIEWHYDVDQPTTIAERLSASFSLGQYEYQRWYYCEADGPAVTRHRNEYRILHRGVVVHREAVEKVTPLILGQVLLSEIAAAGLTAVRHGQALLVLYKPSVRN